MALDDLHEPLNSNRFEISAVKIVDIYKSSWDKIIHIKSLF